MKTKGFTLIELLAVIVILAMIALIATPIIIGVIKESRKGAFGNSASGIMKAAELVYMNYIMETGRQEEQIFTYDDYTETDENGNHLKLEYKGQKPEFGEIIIKTDGSVTLWLWRDGFCAIKGDNDEGVTVTERSSGACGQTMLPPTIMIAGYANNNHSIVITMIQGDTLILPEVTAEDSDDNDLTEDIVQSGNVDINTPGDYVITYTVTDSNNNVRTRSITVRVQDNVAPTVTFTRNGDSTWKKENGSTVLVEDTNGVDNSSLYYLWSTSTTTPVEEDFTIPFTNNTSIYDNSLTKNGIYYLWVLTKDTSGNTAIVRSNGFHFDTTAPVLSLMTITATNVTENGFTITRTGNATDTHLATNPYTYQVSLDGTAWTNAKLLTNDTTAEITGLTSGDTRYYRVCAVDIALNSSCSNSQTITTLAIVNGMIPIKWNGTTWVKASSDNMEIDPSQTTDWYSYTSSEKRWANAVMVTDTSRNSYLTAPTNTPIQENDVLGYLVWIPRYRYQLFNVSALESSPQLINIEFEDSSTSKSNGSTNGSWLTHPAFTFGSQELEGIWVGKFETTGNATTPTVLPYTSTNTGITSLRSQTVSAQFATSQKFSNTHIYGLTSNNDAHMMKNTEWGAAAYLTSSQYGQGLSEVWNNSNNSFLTGCAGDSVSAASSATCNQYHTTNGVKASTTGNIYGIYDMSGGTLEYVMGYNSGTLGGSGFSNLPDAKYYDAYTSGTTRDNQVAYNRRILGDATGELRVGLSTGAGWNNDFSFFVHSTSPVFYRGGNHTNATLAGIFAFASNTGASGPGIGFRVVVLGY